MTVKIFLPVSKVNYSKKTQKSWFTRKTKILNIEFAEIIPLNLFTTLVILIFLFLVVAAALLNSVSVKWSARIVTLTSLGKLAAMGVIIVAGIVKFAQG